MEYGFPSHDKPVLAIQICLVQSLVRSCTMIIDWVNFELVVYTIIYIYTYLVGVPAKKG